MNIVKSADGTAIAYDRSGAGPAIIFVVGAFNDRGRCAPFAELLAPGFTVITYDRRARGDSGDTAPYAVQREIEDLDALIGEVGGAAAVLGFSSGGVLAVRAAQGGSAITKLALYEPPYGADGRPRAAADLPARLAELVAAGRGGDAVALFQTEAVGLPAEMVSQLRESPYWPTLVAYAQSLVYDATITADPMPTAAELAQVTVPALAISGAETWPFLTQAAAAIADALPAGRHLVVPGGKTHDLVAEVVAPVLAEFVREPEHR
jgi:pimeloyl-ACP methyl ester carboxylesterase